MDNSDKFFSNDICPKTALYGQFYGNDQYAGREHERKIYYGRKFPKTKKGYYFKKTNEFLIIKITILNNIYFRSIYEMGSLI
ncbi:hypothetical protein [Proteus mirabilis]|uniref:hypothetical protein n=2 Tax=Proteus mirabilis TaxID=584 RepID=UPI003D08813F